MNITKLSSRFGLVVAGIAATSLLLGGCCKTKKKSSGNTCPQKFRMLTGTMPGADASCTCKPGQAIGSVWGSDIYTTDSSICAAATHAGVITSAGGKVTMRKLPGCAAYEGKKRNGVSSASWGNYSSSFYFVQPGKPPPSCYMVKKGTVTSAGTSGVCPRRFKDVELPPDKTLRCQCTPDRITGSVWGTVTYTTDSSPCKAARHAGVIPAAGGSIEAKLTSGCSRYKGTASNGIKTGSWGRYGSSFYFPSKSSGQCQ